MYFGLWPGQWPGDWRGRNNAEIAVQVAATEAPDVVAIVLGDAESSVIVIPAVRRTSRSHSIRRPLYSVQEIKLRASEGPDVAAVAVSLEEALRDDTDLEIRSVPSLLSCSAPPR